ncbi:MAG: hypothetical protein AAF449_20320, partial [Myxococcota bacterium]
QAGNYFIDSQCSSCHLSDYRRSMAGGWHELDLAINADPQAPFYIVGIFNNPNQGVASTDCGVCHNQFAWGLGARNALP